MQTLPYALNQDASAAEQLKWRLQWGEPALSIIDVRDREAFRNERITGAMSMPFDELESSATKVLEPMRDIYIYGESDERAERAADLLQAAGFNSVTPISGGLEAWKQVSGPIEGIEVTA